MKRRALLGMLPVALLPATGFAQDIDRAQKPLPTETLTIVGRGGARHEFKVEMANTLPEQTVGLMWRTSVAPDSGMLFDWHTPQVSNMWMRNTLVPLDMVFINADGTIRTIAENAVPRSLAIVSSGGPVRATLELAGGITAKRGITVGDKVIGGPFGGS